ncbi:hypothetical protein BSL78_03322 [Apostichopus japonicus]|uniref:Uncharacterized protein n=1 Tax=Stichopus japonicus TaxID=307972 RepID=A0A2G8LHU1_STIJA|nr:hypothetical protein BSL78_03322 [Apostichopus japonicus]
MSTKPKACGNVSGHSGFWYIHLSCRQEIPEDDSLRQVSTIPAPEPKKAIHVSYKALPSVSKPGKNLAKHPIIIKTSGGSKSFETEKQQLNAGTGSGRTPGYGGSNEKEEESRDGDIIADVNSTVTGGHRFSIPKEVPPTFQEPPVENVMLADSGCYNEFVALQKQEINRIEAQLAELAKQKELAERSIALAEGGDTDGESVPRLESSPAIRTLLQPSCPID